MLTFVIRVVKRLRVENGFLSDSATDLLCFIMLMLLHTSVG